MKKILAAVLTAGVLATGSVLPAQAISEPPPTMDRLYNQKGSHGVVNIFFGKDCKTQQYSLTKGGTVYGSQSFKSSKTMRYKIGKKGKYKQVSAGKCVSGIDASYISVFVYRGAI